MILTMTSLFRIILLAVSLVTFFFVIKSVRNSKVRIEDAAFWICFALLVIFFAIWPDVFFYLSKLVGVFDATNFVFLFFIFVLLVIIFRLNIRISQADTRNKILVQFYAISKYERYKESRDVPSDSFINNNTSK